MKLTIFPFLIGISGALLVNQTGKASTCPVVLSPEDFGSRLADADRSQLRLFTLSHQNETTWQELQQQVDWRDSDGHLLLPGSSSARFKRLYKEARKQGYSDNDRIVFADTSWGEQYKKTDRPPCKTTRLYEIKRQSSDQYLYLAACPAAAATLRAKNGPEARFRFAPDQRFVQAPGYQFSYSKSNHILFDRIMVEGIEVGRSADLRIRSDVKRFFTLDFASDDVESEIAAHHVGQQAFLANLTFYLKILFFKIDLELNTGMSFFANAVHIPMILHMPVEAHEWLHPASGTFYSWEIDPKVMQLQTSQKDLPQLDADKIKKGWQELAKTGLRYCDGPRCTYWLRGAFGEHEFSMQYVIPKRLVERGFFPQFTLQTHNAEVDLGWRDQDDVDHQKTRVGIYFESSGLRQGEHEWEFWIKLGKDIGKQPCPATGKLVRVHKISP